MVDTYIISILGIDLPLFIYAGLCPLWVMFFATGCKLGNIKRDYKLNTLFVLALLSLILSYLETYYLNTNFSGGYGIKLSVFIFSLFVILLLFSKRIENIYNNRRKSNICKFFSYVGRISFTIYLIHVFIIYWLQSIDLLSNYWIINIAIVLFTTTIIIWIVEQLLPIKFRRLIGL